MTDYVQVSREDVLAAIECARNDEDDVLADNLQDALSATLSAEPVGAKAALEALAILAEEADFTIDEETGVDCVDTLRSFIMQGSAEPVRPSLPSPPVSGEAVAWRHRYWYKGLTPEMGYDTCMVPWKFTAKPVDNKYQYRSYPGFVEEPLYLSPLTNEPVGQFDTSDYIIVGSDGKPRRNEPVGVILPQDDASFIAEMLLGSIAAIETEDASFTSTDRAAALILRAKLKRLVSALNGEQ